MKDEVFKILYTHNPEITSLDTRNLQLNDFLSFSVALLKETGKVYFSIHNYDISSLKKSTEEWCSLRLWTKRPGLHSDGRADWTYNNGIAVIETLQKKEIDLLTTDILHSFNSFTSELGRNSIIELSRYCKEDKKSNKSLVYVLELFE